MRRSDLPYAKAPQRGVGLTSGDGMLYVYVELKVPHAHGGQWGPGRLRRLAELIEDHVVCLDRADAADGGPHGRTTRK